MTKVFQNGGSQAVRIPAEFRFDEGAEIEIYRGENGEVCIKQLPAKGSLAELASKILSGEIQGGLTNEQAKEWMAQIRADRDAFEWRDPWAEA
ncbi:MAG: AbrB/MazE/SpoVT family DNA-binding domain-containing protein [Actinobacteria bacterium]|nr:AbrB/MazE/SpoVT family DNA-binding domain-containing protein [Actinomycetota bacterium]